ncbi:MAG: ATP-binding cassette domain-containing protein [Acidimicrobiales bacterium]
MSFSVGQGEVLGVVGESGAGKSVSAMAVLGLLPPTASVAGSARYRGRELLGMPDHQLDRVRGARVAMIFQDPMSSLNPVHRVEAQIAEAVRVHGGASRSQARERAVDRLDLVGMPQAAIRAHSYPHELSGGCASGS